MISVSKASSTSFSSSSRCPRSDTIGWWPGTMILTCVIGMRTRLPGRPAQRAPAEQVQVQVPHALPRVGADVRDEAPPAPGDALGVREVRGPLEEVDEEAG